MQTQAMALAAIALVAFPRSAPSPTGESTEQKDPRSTPEPASALQRSFDELAEAGFSGSVLVVRGDETLLDAGAGLADRTHGRVDSPDTIYDVGSITKQFTATAILQLAQQKKLSTSDGLDKFFKDVPADKKSIRLHHLLTHTSGLPADIPVGSATTDRDDLVHACLAAKMQSQPGEQFVYNNVGYMMLGAVVEIVSKQTYESYVSEHLFTPAAMTSSGFLQTPGIDTARVAHGYEGRTAFGVGDRGWYSWGLRGAGGVLSTTGDLMRWWRALQGDAILAKSSRDELFKPTKFDYACGWWVKDTPGLGRVIQHGGTTRGFEGQYRHYLDHDLHVIVLCNDRGRSDAAADALLQAALGKRATDGGTPLSAAELTGFAGPYELARGGKLTVRADGDALVLELDDRAVIAQELGSADKKLDNDSKLAERAKKIVALLDAGDARGAQALLTTKWPGWNAQMVKVWEKWRDERGKLQKVETLGSSGGDTTFVRLVHERRSVVWTLHWESNVLSAWTLNAGLPEAGRFRSRSGAVFACAADSDQGNGELKLEFDHEPGAAARRLTLSGGNVRMTANRLR